MTFELLEKDFRWLVKFENEFGLNPLEYIAFLYAKPVIEFVKILMIKYSSIRFFDDNGKINFFFIREYEAKDFILELEKIKHD